MPSYPRTISLEQQGTIFGAIWTEFPVGTDITVPQGALVGLLYSVQLAGGSPFSMETGFSPARALDPPIWVSTGTLTLTNTGVPGGEIDIYLVPDPSPDLFSAANPPTLTGASLLFENAILMIGPGSTTTVTLDRIANTTIRALVASSVYWTGRIALVLDWNVGVGSTLQVSSLVDTTFQTFWSGAIGGPSGPRRRFVRDHRYGMPALNSELVRDSYAPGLWVRPWDQDPEDPPNTYQPRPGEGTVDDGIGDL